VTISARNVLTHELIGLDVRVLESSNPSNISIHGDVVDESRNTLMIRHEGKVKRLEKKTSVFVFKLQDCTSVEVDGSFLVGRPEDRVKRKTKRRW